MPPSAASKPRFVHLHLHSEYSLLDGGNRLDDLITRVKELGMDAVAVTDHGNLYGAIEFYNKAKSVGIKPILGIEAYIAIGDRRDRVQTGIADGGFHLVLLAEDNTGWQHLLKLSSDSFINGFYYKPRMDKTTLTQYADGLIAINGHLGSSIAHHLLNYEQTNRDEHWQNAVEEARWHADTFGVNESGDPRFYIELQRHEVNEQTRINPHLIRLAAELNLPLVCDNDAHFLTRDSWDAHDTLCCISMQRLKSENDRIKYPQSLYVKSPAEMADTFHDLPEALENSVRIADRCNVELDFGVSHAPVVRIACTLFTSRSCHDDEQSSAAVDAREVVRTFDCEHDVGSTEWFKSFCSAFDLEPFDSERDKESPEELKQECDTALRLLAEAGAVWRYGIEGITHEIRERLTRELTILADKNISAYFLIVWDFVNWARQRGIPANARGSGVGTMVGYVLGLSNACPVKYGLLFERFTDPDRSEYPDIDIDICQDGRAAVINYVREKYGHVAQIITFGRMKARQAIKDVARVMNLSAVDGQRLANLIPGELHITIDEALQKEPELKKRYESESDIRKVVDHARALENHARHTGIHAAGVVVATQPLDNIVPLGKATGTDDIITQWDGPTCEKVGLLKMDFLGLRTLSTIERAKALIRETLPADAIAAALHRDAASGDPLDLDRLTFDDPKVFELFRRGDVAGVFQFESSGMKQTLVEMGPDRLEDLIAANALYRPGPMDLIPNYNNRKHGRESVPPAHDIVAAYTSETYGIMVYQEQVMQIVHGLGDIPLRAAYSLIKAISKKKQKDIDAVRPRFIEGAREKGLSQKQANELFDLILKFAGYGFNKSHSTGYAIIAYQTAFLKTYFPNQYMAALLSFESQARKVEDWAVYLEECRKTAFPDHTDAQPHVGVEVLPPDINLSAADFTVVFTADEPRDNLHGHIRFGLGAVKGAGNAAIRAIVSERDEHGSFASIFDFCERVDLRSVNRAVIEAMVKCGAFDSLHGRDHRAATVASIEDAMKAGQTVAADRRAGQSTFFDSFAASQTPSPSAQSNALPVVTPWNTLEALQFEKDVLGFHVSGHPLDSHRKHIEAFCSHSVRELNQLDQEISVVVAGVVTRVRQTVTKSGRNPGQKMAWVGLQDKTGSIEGVVFADAFSKHAHLLETDRMLMVVGRLDRRRAEPGIVVDRLIPLEQAAAQFTTRVEIDVKGSGVAHEMTLKALRQALFDRAEVGPGSGHGAGAKARVMLNLFVDSRVVSVQPSMLRVTMDEPLLEQLKSLVGDDRVRLHGDRPDAYVTPRDSNGNGYRKWDSKRSSGPMSSAAVDSCASIDRY